LTETNENLTDRTGSLPVDGDRFVESGDEVSLREIAIIPLKRKRTVIGCALLGLLMAILVVFGMTPKYKATATIELNESKDGGVSALSDLASAATGGADDLKVKIQTEMAVIQNDSIALAVMNKMGMLRLEKPSKLSKAEGPIVSPDALPAKRREAMIGAFKAHLQVKEVGNSRLIAITYTSKDPVQAANIANQVVVEYKLYLLNSNYSSSKDVSQWLGSQLSDLSSEVTKSQQAVAEFERSHNLSASMLSLASLTGGGAAGAAGGSGSGGGGVHIQELDRLSSLNEEVTQAEALRLEDEAIYRLTSTQNPDVISSLGSSPLPGLSNSSVMTQGNGLELLNTLRGQEATAKIAYADAATKYGAKNPRLVGIQNQLNSLQKQIQSEMGKIKQRAKNDLTLAQQNEQALQSAYKSQEAVTSKMNDDLMQLGVLMAEARSSRELYDILYAKLQEANVDAGNRATNVTLADPARTPGTPWVPQPVTFPVLGFGIGLLLGISLAFLLESQDDTLRDNSEVEALTHVPVLSSIPFNKKTMKNKTEGMSVVEESPFLSDPKGATAESLRSLRSGLALSGVGRRLKLISVTSSLQEEGKSYLVYNLGLAFAATGLRVLIIDADLRRPTQHFLFHLLKSDGLSNLLAGMASFDDVVQQHSVSPNLFLMSAGQSTPLASELLMSNEIEKVLQIAKEKFDLVLVDNAPVLPVSDPIQIASRCDGTIGVIRSGRTSRKALRRFAQILSRNHIHLLGMVMQAVDMSANEYRSVYGYYVEKYYGEN